MTDEGWVQRFTIERERAEALAEVYQSAGNETRIESVTPEDMETRGPECASCVEAACGQFVTVLTRRRTST
ncbi:MAG: hypothetical protein GY745_16255 [Actinomycetia bacterium]|nr:hypothetical protein [Actinomycetes bacterium]MCP3913270.1 hypothetical protein [Actinomycetes bacterium]MCP4086586.1 hypothetical protein [Actinomycetes bacterium]